MSIFRDKLEREENPLKASPMVGAKKGANISKASKLLIYYYFFLQ